MSITEIASKAQGRERILGTHRWNPPYLIPRCNSIRHATQESSRRKTENFCWSVIGVGYPAELNMAAMGIMIGSHVCVGLEDNIYSQRGVLTTNVQLVEKAVRLADEFEREIATPDEARAMPGLKGRDAVNF